jgi:hypothetical protein
VTVELGSSLYAGAGPTCCAVEIAAKITACVVREFLGLADFRYTWSIARRRPPSAGVSELPSKETMLRTILVLSLPFFFAATTAHAETCPAPGPPISTYEQLPDNSWYFESTVILEEKERKVWHVIRDIEQVLAVALPGIAENFAWVTGGVNHTPSIFEFDALGAHATERVILSDNHDMVLMYDLVTPVLGLMTYIGTMDVDSAPCKRAKLTFSREVTFADDASAPTFADLFHGEATAIQAYFAD